MIDINFAPRRAVVYIATNVIRRRLIVRFTDELSKMKMFFSFDLSGMLLITKS